MAGETRATACGDFAADFVEDRLSNLCDPKSGVQTGPFGSQLHQEDYVTVGTPIITVEHLGENRIFHEDVPKVSDEDKERLSKYTLRKGDIVFSRVGSVDRRALVRDAEAGWLFSGRCLRVRPDLNKIDSGYLSYFFGLQSFKEHIRAIAVGATMPSLNTQLLSDVVVPHPQNLSEQRAIAHILGALDDKIELNRKMNETLEAMAQAIFKSWFVDFDPVRAKAEGRQPIGLDPEIVKLFPDSFQTSELGRIPTGWHITDFPEEIDFLEGPGLRNWQYRDAGMKFLNIRCIVDGDLDIAKANAISLEEFEKTYSHFALREDDIVISTSGTIGRLAIVRSDHLPVMLNTSIIRMCGRDPVGLAYVWGLLQSVYFLEEMFALAVGSVQLNFGPMHLRKIKVLRPPDDVLRNFEKVATPLIRKTLHNRRESRTLATIRDALLPKLLSGEIRVKDAEKFVEKRQ